MLLLQVSFLSLSHSAVCLPIANAVDVLVCIRGGAAAVAVAPLLLALLLLLFSFHFGCFFSRVGLPWYVCVLSSAIV